MKKAVRNATYGGFAKGMPRYLVTVPFVVPAKFPLSRETDGLGGVEILGAANA